MAERFPVDFGDYRLLRKVAQGGMAEIFLATDQDGNVCALKRILPHLAHQEGFIRMFIDEARIVSHLDHPNIAGVYAQGKHEGYYYIAMEYVEGHSVLALQEAAKQQRMALPRGLLAYIVAELLGGLGSAHAARDGKGRHLQIVHRDVTPQNVMVAYDGSVKLIDFGVAKARARLTQTEAGFTKGKLSYMSPEQARGEELDGRSDLFSVGIILHEITTGGRLFNKEGPGGILSAIVNDPIPPPSLKDRKYPRDLEAIVMRALEKEPDRRWQTAEEMRDALMRFAGRERPRPSRDRLANLVHDLFGDPKHRSLIAEAKGVSEPTPPEGAKVELVEGSAVRVRGNVIPDLDTDGAGAEPRPPPGRDETRMMDLAKSRVSAVVDASAQVVANREVTSDGTPIVNLPLERDELPVPEPKLPLRVRLAQRLASFSADVRVSWDLHRRRYLTVFAVLGLLMFVGVTWATGLGARMVDGLSAAVETGRGLKQAAGLDPTVSDAGLQPTTLMVRTEPPGAMIAVDGVGAGCVTPCELRDLEPGRKLAVELSLAGFRTRTERLTLRPMEGLRELEVGLERQSGRLSVRSEPPGATVQRDGKALPGETPLTIDGVAVDVPIQLRVKRRGFRAATRVVVLRDGEDKVEDFVLEIDPASIKPGRIDVDTFPSGCTVKLGDEVIGSAPIRGHVVKEGTYTIEASCENHASDFTTISVDAGGSAKATLRLEPNVFGYLSITVFPPDGSRVTINDTPVPLPIRFLKVVPGRHVIEVENDRLRKKKSMSVRIGPNQRVSRDVNLSL